MEKEWNHSKSPYAAKGFKWRTLNHNGFIETTECTSDSNPNPYVIGWTLLCCGGGIKPVHSWPNKVNDDFPQPANDF